MATKRLKARKTKPKKSKKEKRPTYYAALGRFVTDFALGEIALFLLLIGKSRLELNVGRAILSGVRIDVGIDYLRRIAQAKTGSRELTGHLTGVLEQLKAISTIRNDILHYGGINGDAFERSVSNDFKALTPDQERVTLVTAETLMAMSKDCAKAAAHMLAEASLHSPLVLQQFGGQLPQSITDDLARAWQYKPQQPERPRSNSPADQKTPAPPKRRAPQRRS